LRPRLIIPVCLALLCGLAPGSQAAKEDLYASAIRLITDRYLYPELLTAEDLLAGSAEELTDEVAWLMAEVDGNKVLLRYGVDEPLGQVEVGGLDDLPRAMAALESLVADSAHPLKDDLQLDVEILQGALGQLDRHSAILAGSRLERFNERLTGKLTGIGARIGSEDGEILVRSVFADGPADQGGLRADDVILRIDGISTLGMLVTDATDRIRGPADSSVRMLVRRGERELNLELIRAEVKIPNLEREVLPSGVGYISIANFSEQTVENLRRALAELASQGALERGLVLDLRGNTGGSMIQAARSADQFLADGRLVRTVGREGAPVNNLIRQMDADDEGTEPPVPLVVLTDDRTASGSEILAGDLALLDRAILLGERSYGKGTVQKIYNLRPDVRLKLTVAEYLLVDDVSVASQGLEPDVPTGEVIFDHNGVRYYDADAADQGVLFVRERPGWRPDQEPDPRDDPEVALAERIVLRSRGPHRDDILAAARRVVEEQRVEEDTLLLATYAAGGIDWSPAPSSGPEPALRVRLETDGPPRAGEPLVMRALVDNLGQEDLHRVRVVVWSENRAWNGISLPVGRVSAGGSAEGRRVVKLSANEPARVDQVSVQVTLDKRPSPPHTKELLRIRPRPEPNLSVQGMLVPDPHQEVTEGTEAWRAELTLHNQGREDLRVVQVKFDFPADENIELLDREGLLPALPSGEERRVDLGLLTLPGLGHEELPLELRIDAEHFGRMARWDFPLSTQGEKAVHQAPVVDIKAPLTAPAHQPLRVSLKLHDDSALDHAVVYVNGKKQLYLPGTGRRAEGSLSFTPDSGSNRIAVYAEDDQGHRVRQLAWVLGELDEDDPAVAQEGEEDPQGE